MIPDLTLLAADLTSMSAEQQLVLKLQGAVAMSIFGGIAGLGLRRAFRAIYGDGFIDRPTSRRSPLRPP